VLAVVVVVLAPQPGSAVDLLAEVEVGQKTASVDLHPM